MLAIVIPYFKRSLFESTLDSLANQTDKRFVVYIGDDASPEDPHELLKKYRHRIDFVYQRFNENIGSKDLTKQWERCIELTKDEEWIMILGDDDLLSKNVVESFYRNKSEIKNHNCNLIRFSSKSVDKVRNFVSKSFQNPKLEKASDSFYRKCLGQSRSSLSEYIFKKEVYLKYKFKNYPLAWHSDDFAWIEFSENSPIYSINDAVVSINVSDESLSGKTDNLKKKNEAQIYFYKDLVNTKLKLFKKNQQERVLIETELAIKKYRKMAITEWLNLSGLYLCNLLLFQFLKFVNRTLKGFF